MNYTDGHTLFKAACLPDYVPSLSSFSHSPIPSSPHVIDNNNNEPPPSTQGIYPHPIIRIHSNSNPPNPPPSNVPLASPFHKQQKTSSPVAATQDNKTKLILDLSGNPGGGRDSGLNIFSILFPDLKIRTATRFRATEINTSTDLKGEEVEEEVPIDPPFIASVAVRPDQKTKFKGGWEEIFGPDETIPKGGQGNMSRLLAHFDLELASTETDPLFGYGALKGSTEDGRNRPFKAEDIVVIGNKRECASTCALLISSSPSEGVKGGQYWSLKTIYRHISRAVELAVGNSASLTEEELQRLKELAPVDPDPVLGAAAVGEGGVNFRDLYYLDDDGDEEDDSKEGKGKGKGMNIGTVPAQFIYEPAECRRPARMWEVAREVMFGGGECVEGSKTGSGSGKGKRPGG
ncbi:hypothetical protein QR685DRAFT_538763 [Neurospora intermedia]|uniref:Tail specific protease domain-containing protein n=1 Tax=Neurospora intermedia TaxID=5142 RepID=A0ABR3CYK7_NEUIN